MQKSNKNFIVNLISNEFCVKYLYVLLIPLIYCIILFYSIMYGSDGKGGQLAKYRTDKNGVRYSKPKGLMNIFKKWEKISPAPLPRLDIISLYPSIVLDKPLRVR